MAKKCQNHGNDLAIEAAAERVARQTGFSPPQPSKRGWHDELLAEGQHREKLPLKKLL